MKRFVTINAVLGVCTLLVLFFTACTKSESPYYDYVNKDQFFDGSALDYLNAQAPGTFDSLLLVLDRFPELKDSLLIEELTLFAPVNKCFEAAIKYLNNKREAEGKSKLYLNDVDPQELKILLCKYLIRGNRTTEDYMESTDGVLLPSLEYGYPMHIKYNKMSSAGFVGGGASTVNLSNPFGSSFTNDWVTTKASTVNIRTDNATINILDPIHSFGFDEFTDRLDN